MFRVSILNSVVTVGSNHHTMENVDSSLLIYSYRYCYFENFVPLSFKDILLFSRLRF